MKRTFTNYGSGGNSPTQTFWKGGCNCGRVSFFVPLLIVALVLTVRQQPLQHDRELLELFFTDVNKATTTDVTQTLFRGQNNRRRRSKPFSSKFPTITCPTSLDVTDRQRQKVVGGVSDPNEGRLHTRRTITDPDFWISLHQQSFDPIRWDVMKDGYYYESKQTESFVEILQQEVPSAAPLHFVDVGGNIGWYSLVSVAAAMAVNRSIVVDVFEPNPRNRYRMCESLQLNHWADNDQVDFHLYPLGVSSSSGGVVQMSVADSGIGKLGRVSTVNKKENLDIHLVSLDDMSKDQSWEASRINILKVDVEGLELEVFQGAKRLLQAGTIDNIFFEGNARSDEEIAKFRDIVKLLVESGYFAYKHGGWSGADKLVTTSPIPRAKEDAQEKESRLQRYIKDVLDECSSNQMDSPHSKNAQCNLWWRKTEAVPPATSA